MEYTYGDYEGAECNFIGLKIVVWIILIVIDAYKDVYTLAIKDCDVLKIHIDCEMKCRGSCIGGRDREKECATPMIVATPSKEGDLQMAF